ncbi:hypothetical protein J6590_091831 [Homalodisca vitripennis]|nr:hypothetical protein J6590_091831 [Homalodisca vitripennis]
MGCRLRKLKQKLGRIFKYYGNAIRGNNDDLEKLGEQFGQSASAYPPMKNQTTSLAQRLLISGANIIRLLLNERFINTTPVPKVVMEAIIPIFKECSIWCHSRIKVLKRLGITDFGKNTIEALQMADYSRIRKAELAARLATKEARIKRRRKSLAEEEVYDLYYCPGVV